jgi:hypothetical protein
MSEPPMAIAYRAKEQIEALREPRKPYTDSGQPIDPIPPDPAIVDALETLCDAVIKLMHRLSEGGPT